MFKLYLSHVRLFHLIAELRIRQQNLNKLKQLKSCIVRLKLIFCCCFCLYLFIYLYSFFTDDGSDTRKGGKCLCDVALIQCVMKHKTHNEYRHFRLAYPQECET